MKTQILIDDRWHDMGDGGFLMRDPDARPVSVDEWRLRRDEYFALPPLLIPVTFTGCMTERSERSALELFEAQRIVDDMMRSAMCLEIAGMAHEYGQHSLGHA